MKVFDCAKEVKIKLPLILLVQTSDTFEFNLPAFLHSDRTEESFFGGVGTGGGSRTRRPENSAAVAHEEKFLIINIPPIMNVLPAAVVLRA